MARLDDRVFDNGLSVLSDEANELHICSDEPATYVEATSTYSLGEKASPTIAAPSDRTGGGREVEVAAINDGSVTDTGTASHYAIVDTANSRLLAAGSLDTPQSVTNGNTFTLSSFTIGIPDPA